MTLDRRALSRLRKTLLSCDFTSDAATAAEPSPVKTLFRLFVIGAAVDRRDAETALPGVSLPDLAAMGILRVSARSATPLLRIIPHGELLITSDHPSRSHKRDFVPGPSDSSIFLELFTIRRTVRRTLDLGAGCGIQALWASMHSDRVDAVDMNPRAAQITELNAALNGFRNIHCRVGDAFAPVRQQKYDLIVGNLPFVIGPSVGFIYRDSGLPLDAFARQMVGAAPQHLADGGFCQFLLQWVELEGEDWRARISGWLKNSGCDAWLLRTGSLPPDSYVEKWMRETEPPDRAHDSSRFERWLEYLRSNRVLAVHSGAIAMRRSETSKHWLHISDGPVRVRAPFGDRVVRMFTARDRLDRIRDDQQLLRRRVKLSKGARLVEELEHRGEGWYVQRCELHENSDLQFSTAIEPRMARVLAHASGKRTVSELLEALPPASAVAVDPPDFWATIRRLILEGFLLT